MRVFVKHWRGYSPGGAAMVTTAVASLSVVIVTIEIIQGVHLTVKETRLVHL